MKTFRELLKEELKKRNIPVEISKWCERRIKNTGDYFITTKGVRIERRLVNMYQSCTGKKDKNEDITITTNGYISKEEMNKIVEELKENYNARLYNPEIKKLSVWVIEEEY